jgi:hypothetical protein
MISIPRNNMIHHGPSRASAVPFNDQAKAATPKMSARTAPATGPRQSMRVVGTLHLPDLVRPR